MRDQLKVNTSDAFVQVEEDAVMKESIMTQTESEIFKVPAIPEMVMETELLPLDLSCKALIAPMVESFMDDSDLFLSQNTVNNLLESYHLTMEDTTQIITSDALEKMLDTLPMDDDELVPTISQKDQPSTSHMNVVQECESWKIESPLKRGYKVIPNLSNLSFFNLFHSFNIFFRTDQETKNVFIYEKGLAGGIFRS